MPSPTTTKAAKEKRLPPLTTLATRLMVTTVSLKPSLGGKSLPGPPKPLDPKPDRPPGEGLPAAATGAAGAADCPIIGSAILKLQPRRASGVRESLDSPVIAIGAAVKHHGFHPGLHRGLRN